MAQLKAIETTQDSSSDLEVIELENGEICYKTAGGGRSGTLPSSGIEFRLRPRTVGDSQKLERAMGGSANIQAYQTEAIARMFVSCCEQFGDQKSCSLSQVYELDEATDGQYIGYVMASFRPTPKP